MVTVGQALLELLLGDLIPDIVQGCEVFDLGQMG